jgi:hypothetical protein
MERGCNSREMWLTSYDAEHKQFSGPYSRGARVCSRVLHFPRSGVVKDSSSSSPILRFGVFELHPRSGELRKQGIEIRLQGQPVEILAMLLKHRGETITRDELQKKLCMGSLFGVSESARSLSSAFLHQALLLRLIHSNYAFKLIGFLTG